MPTISIIVPVYKAEKYIESCVRSILAQTYGDFELILMAYEMLNGAELLANFSEHCRKVSLISLCMKLFKREVFNGLRIPEGYIDEDSMSLPHILERSRRIARSGKKLYHWRVTPGSVTRSGLTEKSFAHIEVSRYQAEIFAERGSNQADYFRKEFLMRVLHFYYKVQDEKPELMGALKPYIETYHKLYPRYIRAKGLCIRERIAYALFLISPKAARKFYTQVHGGEAI